MKTIIQTVGSGKKAQIKMQQTAFMLIALTLFFVLVGLFFLNYSLSGLKAKKAMANQDEVIKKVARIANSPEFSCGGVYKTNQVSCIDFDKVMALTKYVSDYENFWGVENIVIREVYPESSNETLCTSENYPNCNYVDLLGKGISGFDKSTYVVLCRKDSVGSSIYDKCVLAKLMVRYKNA